MSRWESEKDKARKALNRERRIAKGQKVITLPTPNFSKAVEQADIGAARFHDLRHSYGSHKLTRAPIYLTMLCGGWAIARLT